MGRFQVEAVSFHVAVHFFDPHAFAVDFQQGVLAGPIRNQVPGFIFTGFPMQEQPIPSSVMFFCQAHPANQASLAWLERQRIDFDPALPIPTHFVFTLLADDKMPVAPPKPAQQADRLEFGVANHPDFGICWQYLGDFLNKANCSSTLVCPFRPRRTDQTNGKVRFLKATPIESRRW